MTDHQPSRSPATLADEELASALAVDDPKKKNYHIRRAFQALVIQNDGYYASTIDQDTVQATPSTPPRGDWKRANRPKTLDDHSLADPNAQ